MNLLPKTPLSSKSYLKSTANFALILVFQSKALEDHYCKQRKLLNFEVPGDIKEAWPGLLSALDLKDIDTTSQRLNCLTFYN
jgi:hypothetical protein